MQKISRLFSLFYFFNFLSVAIPTLKEIWDKMHTVRVHKSHVTESEIHQDDHIYIAPYVQPIVMYDDTNKKVKPFADVDGNVPTAEKNSTTNLAVSNYVFSELDNQDQTFMASVGGFFIYKKKRIRVITCLALSSGGDQNDQTLLPALAGYVGVVEIRGIISDGTLAAGLRVTFQDSADVACEAVNDGVINMGALTAGVLNTTLQSIHVRGTVANRAIEVDLLSLAGGADAGKIVSFECIGWYEMA